jgi:predicted peroxiredoxin
MKILYLASAGADDATRASLSAHLAANGSVAEGQDCAYVLVGDATELVARDKADQVTGVGIPPLRELLQKLVEHAVPVYV